MLKFKNMRDRVDYAYYNLNVDIFYEGDYLYTIKDYNEDALYEMLTENEMDRTLNLIWNKIKASKRFC